MKCAYPFSLPAKGLNIEILKMLDQCDNNDFLPNTIRYMDDVWGVEITLPKNRKKISDTEMERNRVRSRKQRENKTLIAPVIKFASYDEWIADNYVENSLVKAAKLAG